MMGMTKEVFLQLSRELQLNHGLMPEKYVSVNEQLAIFVYFLRTGNRAAQLQERFQRSPGTISWYVQYPLNQPDGARD
jgi:hypothetical protein